MTFQATNEQRRIIQRVERGESVFITGAAGTGKSALLLEVVDRLRKLHGSNAIRVCAPTGVAAVRLPGGTTLHRLFGVGVSKDTRKSNRLAQKHLSNCKCLIVDEVSQLSAEFLDELVEIARAAVPTSHRLAAAQNEGVPSLFGIQLVVCGDFFQLPPVTGRYCFHSKTWKRLFPPPQCFELTRIFRQRDQAFIRALNVLRLGGVTSKEPIVQRIFECSTRHSCFCDDQTPRSGIKLFPTRRQVDQANLMALQKIPGRCYVFEAEDFNGPLNSRLQRRIELKVGAKVVLTHNIAISDGLVNGTIGTIVGFQKLPSNTSATEKSESLPVVEYLHKGSACCRVIARITDESDLMKTSRSQLPLQLAHALTIHKAQGSEFHGEDVVISLFKKPTTSARVSSGLAYVAVSRVASFSSVHVCLGSNGKGRNLSIARAPDEVRQFYENRFAPPTCKESKERLDTGPSGEKNSIFTSDGFVRKRRRDASAPSGEPRWMTPYIKVGSKENNVLNSKRWKLRKRGLKRGDGEGTLSQRKGLGAIRHQETGGIEVVDPFAKDVSSGKQVIDLSSDSNRRTNDKTPSTLPCATFTLNSTHFQRKSSQEHQPTPDLRPVVVAPSQECHSPDITVQRNRKHKYPRIIPPTP